MTVLSTCKFVRTRFVTANELKENPCLRHVSSILIRRRISECGEFKSFWASMKPFLRIKNVRLRLKWAREHQHWTKEQWSRVLWSDESLFVLVYNKKNGVGAGPVMSDINSGALKEP